MRRFHLFGQTKLLTILFLVLAVILAGCGGGKSDSASSGSKASSGSPADSQASASGSKASSGGASTEKVTLHVLTRYTEPDSMAAAWQEAMKLFKEKHPNVEFQDDSVGEEAAYFNKLKTAIATGNTPNFFYFPSVAGLVGWAKNGIIMDVTPMMEDKAWSGGFIEGAFDIWNLEKYGAKGHYGIPIGFNPEVMFYNPELFAKAGIEKTPETLDELYQVIDKLKAAKIIPWAVGAKDTWRAGHIHNNAVYKLVGVEKVKDLGTRKAKWTDPDVVESLAFIKDLKTRGAFDKGFEGIDYNTEKNGFFSGKYAMDLNGAWMIGDVMSSNSPYKDKISFFPFPSSKDKPEFKDNSVIFSEGFMLSGTMKGAEKEMAIAFAKFFSGQQMQEYKLQKVERLSTRTDVKPADNASKLFKDMVSYMATIKVPGGDTFDYDPDPALIDKSRNAIIGMLLKNTPEEAAKAIQDELDNYDKTNK